MRLEERIATKLKDLKLTLSVAESCTGGLLAHRLTNIPGSSHFFMAGLVTYSNQSKIHLLKVPAEIIESFGAVSAQVACGMAENVRQLLKTDYGIGITGIAGPAGASPDKPVGLVYLAIAAQHGISDYKCQFKGSREEIKAQAAEQALKYFWDLLSKA